MRKLFGYRELFDSNSIYMKQWNIGNLFLHIFYRGDNDPDGHDHPWNFWTFPLTSYVEEVTYKDQTLTGDFEYYQERRVVQAFRFHYRPAEYTYRVLGRFEGLAYNTETYDQEDVSAKEVNSNIGLLEPYYVQRRIVTIVWKSRDIRNWGFLKNRQGKWCWVHWKDYLSEGRDKPCS